MPGKIINGTKISQDILLNVKKEVLELKKKNIVPKLVVMQVGNDSASDIYVNKKHKTCLELGIESEVKKYSEDIKYEDFLKEIGVLNKDDKVHGILVQSPLPEHLSHKKVYETIDVKKDVDGFHPCNHGKNLLGKDCLQAATPKGIMKLLETTGVELAGKHAVVLGRSNIVGKPVAIMLINAGATVTVCNSKTTNLEECTKKAEVLISAVGKPKIVTKNMVKEGAVVIDVGMNRLENGKLCGDVDFEKVKEVASCITPVPGGVGPMTIASLMQNTLKACREIENV